MSSLTYYSAARKALALVVRKDEVADIENKAARMVAYAKRAKDGELIGYATEIRKHAERRLGVLMEEDRKAGKLAQQRGIKGSKGFQKTHTALADQGIDKNLADRARKAEAMSDEKFEVAVAKAVRIAVAAVENEKAIITAARAELHAEKLKKRQKREQQLTAALAALPDKKYAVIVADPEWRFEFWSEKGKTNSSADNHYTTSALDVIKARDVPSISADDCVLFLWATAPMMPHALEVMKAWGFEYKSQACWDKEKAGTGYWFRNSHELLLVGTRGKIPAPAEGDQVASVIREKATKHSAKPECALLIIEKYFPTAPKIELNRRGKPRPGWDAWGNEAIIAEAAE